MAIPGITFQLTDSDREHAVKYVEESGFFKQRLADFLGISRPTLDKLLEEDTDFFTSIKRADTVFCKSLIDSVKKKNPSFLLKTKYREEFDNSLRLSAYDPEEEIKRIMRRIDGKEQTEEPPIPER